MSEGTDAGTGTGEGTGATPPWFQGHTDAEFIGTVQTRGLDKKTPAEAAHNFYQAHREATKMISQLTGTPDKDRILVKPRDDAPDTDKSAFWQKLGRPEKAESYDFKDLKSPTGGEPDEAFLSALRAAAFRANATPEAAREMAKEMIAYAEKSDQQEQTILDGRNAEEMQALKRDWGANYQANDFIAGKGAEALGLTPDELKKMAGAVGPLKVMQAMLKVGQTTTEGQYHQGRTVDPLRPMTREQAVSRLAERKLDQDFMKRVYNGDVAAKAEWEALIRQTVPVAA